MADLFLQVVLFVNAADIDQNRLQKLLTEGIEIEYGGRKVLTAITVSIVVVYTYENNDLFIYLTIIPRNRAEYRLILIRSRRPSWQGWQDNCLIIQHIDNKAQVTEFITKETWKSPHFSTRQTKLGISQDISVHDECRDHYDHIWKELRCVE